MVLDTSQLDAHDRAMVREIARALIPEVPERPSEWARKNVWLTAEMGAEVTGRYDPCFYPWQVMWADLAFDKPRYLGFIAPKFAQAGLTLPRLVACAQHIAKGTGNVFYTIGREEDAETIAGDRMSGLTKLPAVAARLDARDDDDRRSSNITNYPFAGGKITFVNAGSPSGLSSTTFKEGHLDEFDQCERNFPSKNFGSVMQFARGRFQAVKSGGTLWIYSHPTKAKQGIMALFNSISTRHRWVFECPECKGPCDLTSESIVYLDYDDEGKPATSRHRVECPCCHAPIEDRWRQTRVWEARHRSGGAAYLWTPLADEIAATRRFLGFGINGLMNPNWSSSKLAADLFEAVTPEARAAVLNVTFGETPNEQRAGIVSNENIDRAIEHAGKMPALPGHRTGVKFITAGIDVQAPEINPTLYTALAALAADGNVYIPSLVKVSGFAALANYVSHAVVPVREHERPMGVRGVGIDDGWPPGVVKNFCRLYVPSAVSGAGIELVPVRFRADKVLNADTPFVMRSDAKRIDPLRPEMGAIPMYDLHRHSWVDRVIRMIQEGRVIITAVCDGNDGRPTREEIKAHLTSQVLSPLKTQHGYESERFEWARAKDRRDDWLMAIVYAVALAVIRYRADSIGELAEAYGESSSIVVPRLGGGSNYDD